MRVKTNTGICKIKSISLYAELRYFFNHKNFRNVDLVMDINDANFILFQVEDMSEGKDFVVGNLHNLTVGEIVDDLTSQGYCDLTRLSFQPRGTCLENTIFDAGATRPYMLSSSDGFGQIVSPQKSSTLRHYFYDKLIEFDESKYTSEYLSSLPDADLLAEYKEECIIHNGGI